ncbi:Alpha-tectorin [Larimichthys crocea]|uniref:Uncharacterized protein n=1 Tax=Larimichthys crocea TaxID=215358 RepID=A0ACD3RTK4_LARCR|nr:Alpha-tectorin [Larimichthys crocea]
MASQIMLFLLLLGMISVVTSQVVRPLYPVSGTTSSRSDDGSSPRINLQRPFFYFGQTYNQIYVNHNGHLTFNNPDGTHRPQRFPIHGTKDFIAPFWTDLDNRQTGQVYYNQYTSGSVLQQATQDINAYFPSLNFNANWVFVATWYEVAYYSNSGTVDGQRIRLPFSSASNRIQIYHSSIHSVILRTAFGVTVQTVWPHYVRVTAPGIYNGSLGGLCGNYNGHPHDDFQTPNGILVNSSQVFGDSWRDGSLAAHCVDNVNQNSTTNYNSSEYCGILGSPHGPFAQCWATLDPQQHVDSCVDIIGASSDPASALCEVLRDYALMCQQRGGILGNWRNATGCEPLRHMSVPVNLLMSESTRGDRTPPADLTVQPTAIMSCVVLTVATPAPAVLMPPVSRFALRDASVMKASSGAGQAESDPCEQLDCTEYEWCGEKDGVYGCFCDEHHHRPNNESYDSSITCVSSSATISVSRCQLFEAGFHLSALHLRDDSCNGTLQDGRLFFHFNNDDRLCGTILRSNGTHFIYENTIQGDVDPHEGLISREKSIHLHFSCEYPLAQALSMDVGINPVESIVNKRLPSGQGRYHLRMMPYEDAGFHFPLTRNRNVEMEIDQRLYIEVQTEGVDERQISTILDSCWATPFNDASYPCPLGSHHYRVK